MLKPSDSTFRKITTVETELGSIHRSSALFFLLVGAVLLCFGAPLYRWARFAWRSDLYSYVLLVPVVSIYLFSAGSATSRVSVVLQRAVGVGLICFGIVATAFWLLHSRHSDSAAQNSVALATSAFIIIASGTAVLVMDTASLRRAAFPLAFLVFMIPFPSGVEHALEGFLQHGSAPPAYWFFKLAGTPVYRHDMVFQLPGISLQIAPECSGIRSSIVLFMTSLVAGHLFLRSPWKRALLTAAVIPLALVRNGFRVFVIGELCVHVGPHMIDSPIHHYGGTIFFLLSLIPFAALTYFLVRSDRRVKPQSVAS